MSATKILWGQILAVSTVVVAVVWAATEWTAWQLAFQPQLGQPLSRVLSYDTKSKRLFVCSGCGTTGRDNPNSICVCGAKFPDNKTYGPGMHSGLRCIRNLDLSLSPRAIVASEALISDDHSIQVALAA